MTHIHPEAQQYEDAARDLMIAAGFPATVECPTCEGSGDGITMVCHGGKPYEVTETCPDCRGSGEVDR